MIKKIVVLASASLLCSTCPVFSITREVAKKIGLQIWQNETSKRAELLVSWNPHESFPSLGIAHCIWYPHGQTNVYTEQFPALCDYLQKNGVQLPAWLKKARHTGAPWASREELLQDNLRTDELRQLLKTTVDLQIYFMIDRLNQQFPRIMHAVPHNKRKQIRHYIHLMKSSTLGLYALLDYFNFKGDGLNPDEHACGDQWGLLQVLLDMPDGLNEDNVTKAFALSAAKILLQLTQNSAPDYRHLRFFKGWMQRVSTYADEKLFTI